MFRYFPEDMNPSIWQVGVLVTLMFAATKSTVTSKQCGLLQYRIVDPKNPQRTLKCENCPKCPLGMGVKRQCGRWRRVPNGTTINCEQCELNKTFSNTNDSSMCSPCNECQKKIVLHQCTLTQNRKCGGCPPKHFLDPHLDDCIECYFCCPSIPENARMQKCKTLGLLRNEWCEATEENQLCKQNYLRHLNETNNTSTIKPTAKSSIVTEWNSNNTGSNIVTTAFIRNTNSVSYPQATYGNGTDETGNNNLLKAIATSICAAALLVFFIFFIYKKYFQKHSGLSHRKQEYETVEQGEKVEMAVLQNNVPHNKSGRDLDRASVSPNPSTDVSNASSFESVHVKRNEASLDNNPTNDDMECLCQESVHVNRNEASLDNNPTNDGMECQCQANPAQQNVDFDIEGIPKDCVISDMEKLWTETEKGRRDVMIFQVQKKLDSQETRQKRTWRSVGLALQVDPEDLDRILTQTDSPTVSILEYFKTLGAREPKMRTFVQALIGCGREDLAGIICNWSYDVLPNTHRQAH